MTLSATRIIMRTGLMLRRAIFRLFQLSGRLSRVGFNVWHERRGKWR